MTNIHHATRAKAEKAGIVLTDQGATVDAHWPKMNRHIEHPVAKIALALMLLQQRFGLEYVNIGIMTDEDGNAIIGATKDGEPVELVTLTADDLAEGFDEDAVFADALEAMVDAEIEPEEGEDEEGAKGNIVPSKYREKYRAEGHPNTCGDWLANILNDECQRVSEGDGGKTYFDINRFDEIYDQNKGDRGQKWCRNTSGRGWQGRYRMSGRIALAKVVAINGYLVVDKAKLTPPADWLAKHAPKPKNKSVLKEAA